MTSTLTQLNQRTDAAAKETRATYASLLAKPAGGKQLTKIEADKLHSLCQQLGITPDQAAQDEITLKRVIELEAAESEWGARSKELTDEQDAIGDRWSLNAESEARLKMIKDFGEGRARLNEISNKQIRIARTRNELRTLRQNARLFTQEDH